MGYKSWNEIRFIVPCPPILWLRVFYWPLQLVWQIGRRLLHRKDGELAEDAEWIDCLWVVNLFTIDCKYCKDLCCDARASQNYL